MTDQDSWFRRGLVEDVGPIEREAAKRTTLRTPYARYLREGHDAE